MFNYFLYYKFIIVLSYYYIITYLIILLFSFKTMLWQHQKQLSILATKLVLPESYVMYKWHHRYGDHRSYKIRYRYLNYILSDRICFTGIFQLAVEAYLEFVIDEENIRKSAEDTKEH